MSEIQRNADFLEMFDIRVAAKSGTDLHRFSQIAEGILLNLHFICVHLWREPAFRGIHATDDSQVFCRLYSNFCRD